MLSVNNRILILDMSQAARKVNGMSMGGKIRVTVSELVGDVNTEDWFGVSDPYSQNGLQEDADRNSRLWPGREFGYNDSPFDSVEMGALHLMPREV